MNEAGQMGFEILCGGRTFLQKGSSPTPPKTLVPVSVYLQEYPGLNLYGAGVNPETVRLAGITLSQR